MKVGINKKGVFTPEEVVLEIKKRMLEWSNPVEYVNNMYGTHPGRGDMEYFRKVFGGILDAERHTNFIQEVERTNR